MLNLDFATFYFVQYEKNNFILEWAWSTGAVVKDELVNY